MTNEIVRRLEALEASMGTRNNVPQAEIRVVFVTSDAEGKPVPTHELLFQIPPRENES